MKDREKKTIIKFIIAMISFLLCIACLIGIATKKQSLPDQNFASRWDAEGGFAQISCFYAENPTVSEDYFTAFAHTIDGVLLEASLETEEETGRLWLDSVSHNGNISLRSESANLEVSAMGVKGDFFQFHPVKLLYGSYFSSQNLMDDGIIIDEDIAWKLFGSNDVVGMQVTIHEVPHYIIGVIERADDSFSKAAGLDGPLCYLSLNSLLTYGMTDGGFTYEALLPNPVDGYALSIVKENQSVEESKIEIVENSARYEVLSLANVVLEFGTRSMSKKGIIYPYFENVARGWEDVLSLIFIVQMISLIIFMILVISWLVSLWKRRTFTSEDLKNWIVDKKEDMNAKRYKKEKENTGTVHHRKKRFKKIKGKSSIFKRKQINKTTKQVKEEEA